MNVRRLLQCCVLTAGAMLASSAFADYGVTATTLNDCTSTGIVTVRLVFSSTGPSTAAGGQFFLSNAAGLTFSSVTPGPGLQLIFQAHDDGLHTVDLAVGVTAPAQIINNGDTVATIQFTYAGTFCDTANLVSFRPHTPATMLSDNAAQPLAVTTTNLASITLGDTTPAVINGGNALPTVTQGNDANTCGATLATLVNFESGGYTLLADAAGSSTPSTAQSFSATHSARLFLPSGSADFAKIQAPLSGYTVGNASGMFQTYVTPGSAPNLCPYMYFKVDANQNGIDDFTGSPADDAFVILFVTGVPSVPQGRWFTQGINGNSIVHVVGNRTGLTSGQFSSSNGGGLLSALRNTTFSGAVTWGDLNLTAVRVGAGEWPGAGQFEAFVDDMVVARNLELPPSSTDNCDPAPVLTVARGDALPINAAFPSGTTVLTWTASDRCGNSSVANQNVVVTDTQAPSIACPPAIVVNADAGYCTATVDLFSSTTEAFNSNPTLSATQAPGVWYTDRYAPAGFTSAVFAGGNRLKHSISAADCSPCRGGGFTSGFYDTQGRKFDIAGSNEMSIDLYVDASWATSNKRMAGFWGTGFDNSLAVSGFPIIEFTSDGGVPRFRGWDNGVWVDMGLPSGFAYNAFYTLHIQLVGSNFIYTVGNLTLTVPATGSTSIGNVILQGHNNTAGVTYDIYWDNFTHQTNPFAADNCTAMPSISGTRSDMLALNAPYPSGVTTVTWTATDGAGNPASCNQLVTVNPFNTVYATVEETGLTGTSTRGIEFTFYTLVCANTYTHCHDVPFAGGPATVSFDVPCGFNWVNATVADTKHSLRRTGENPFHFAIVDRAYHLNFTTATDKPLQQGNVNNDSYIDILDFGGYVGKFGQTLSQDTLCGALGLHPDFDGNTTIGVEDFNFISFGFLDSREANPCGVPLADEAPITDISVTDLVAGGLRSYAYADFNLDGRLNASDVAWVSQHGLPRCSADVNDDQVVDVSDIFSYLNIWFADHPKADMNNNERTEVQDIFDYINVWFQGC